MVVTMEECGIEIVKISLCRKCHSIAKQREIQVCRKINLQLSCILTHKPCLCCEIIVESTSKRFGYLAANTYVVLIPVSGNGSLASTINAHSVGHGIFAQFVGGEYFQTCLHPFVESLKHGNGKDILHLSEFRLIVDRVARIDIRHVAVVVSVGIISFWCLICLIDMVVVVEVESMDKARHGNILFLHRGGNRVLSSLYSEKTVHLFLTVNLYSCCI